MSSSGSADSRARWAAAIFLGSVGCAGNVVVWSGTAIAPAENSVRESSIEGALDRSHYFERGRINLDRSFESDGFSGVPFAIEAGDGHVLSVDSERASLRVAFEGELTDSLTAVESYVPHFYLDTEVPGVDGPVRYTLVCKGGTGRLSVARDGDRVIGDLAIRVACRTYVDGIERDESEIRLGGAFRAAVR